MDSQLNHRFPHRHNSDGSHDSICITCYATVASAHNEGDLAQHEQDHVCDLVLLGYASQPCRAPSSSRDSDRETCK